MNTIAQLYSLTRPKTLIASIAPVFLASVLALKNDCFDLFKFFHLLITALMLQILCNVANDYFDGVKGVDTDMRVGPKRLTGSNELSLSKMKKILITTFIMTLLFSISLALKGGPYIAAASGVSLMLAIIYTAGPFPLSYNGIAEPFAFLFFGPIPVVFAFYFYHNSFSFQSVLFGLLPGFYSLILLTINNLRDKESDELTSKKTLIVRFGKDFGKKIIFYSFCALIASTFVLSLKSPKMLCSLIIIGEIIYFYKECKKAERPQEFLPLLKKASKLYLTHSALWIGFILV